MIPATLRFLIAACCLLAVSAVPATPQENQQASPGEAQAATPAANPGRPTVATPATLTPVGYLQFETGILAAWHSPGVVSQTSVNEVIKYAPSRWIELLVGTQPYAHSDAPGQPTNAPGDVDLGVQAVLYPGRKTIPTIGLGYFGRAYSGSAADLDIGSFKNSVIVLFSGDVKGFHYDTNYFFNEQTNDPVRRAQFGQTISVSHSLGEKFDIGGELWHFSQPFLQGNAVGNLWAVSYTMRKNLVLDCGFDHGLTSTSTQWEVFAGFTYLLPHKLPLTWPRGKTDGSHPVGGQF